jgi:hypothetical protein
MFYIVCVLIHHLLARLCMGQSQVELQPAWQLPRSSLSRYPGIININFDCHATGWKRGVVFVHISVGSWGILWISSWAWTCWLRWERGGIVWASTYHVGRHGVFHAHLFPLGSMHKSKFVRDPYFVLVDMNMLRITTQPMKAACVEAYSGGSGKRLLVIITSWTH